MRDSHPFGAGYPGTVSGMAILAIRAIGALFSGIRRVRRRQHPAGSGVTGRKYFLEFA